jgi:hypothetical protein
MIRHMQRGVILPMGSPGVQLLAGRLEPPLVDFTVEHILFQPRIEFSLELDPAISVRLGSAYAIARLSDFSILIRICQDMAPPVFTWHIAILNRDITSYRVRVGIKDGIGPVPFIHSSVK